MLPVGQFLLRMGRQPGVDHLAHIRMSFQKRRNFHRRCRLLTDAQSHSFHRLEHEEGGHGGHDVSVHILDEFDSFVKFRSFGNQSTAGTNVESVIILGERLDGEVGSVIERTAYVWRGEGRITHVDKTVTFGNFRNGIEIRQRQCWVGGTLAENELGIRLNRRLDRRGIGKIHKTKFHPQWDELFATDAIGTAIAAVGDDAMITRFHERVDTRCRRRHASGNTDGIVSVLDFGHFLL
mmetsp:Transcript_36895/g.66351  ORF Transcript_36895/g.66351 Transcript_36895/m.66351 type:complete len:237 (-) Transcript_36895:453-1163(-)